MPSVEVFAAAAGAKLKLGAAGFDNDELVVAGVSSAFLPRSPELNPLVAGLAGCDADSAGAFLPRSPKLKPLAAGLAASVWAD